MRWLLLVAFIAFVAPLSAAVAAPMGMAPPPSQSGRTGGITYYGGPVMTGRVNVYAIWYGSFPSWPQTQTIVDYFIANWGASHSYGVLRSYTGSNGRVAPELALAGESLDSGSRGTHLVDADIGALVGNAIQNNTFPVDTNGIYLVFIGQGISLTSANGDSLCVKYCGYHSRASFNGADIKFGVVGSGNCSACGVAHSPNANAYADAMVNTIAHEIAETVTDPDLDAWGAVTDEVGDKCNSDMSEQHNAPNGVPATAKVGTNYYFIQKLWSPTNGGGCYSGYSPPAAIVWQEGHGGAVGAWKMKDANTVGSYLHYNIPSGQNVIAVGDFFADINPQVLTTGPTNTGPVALTELLPNGTTVAVGNMFTWLDATQWKIVATSDFNGDGYSDILMTNPNTGDTYLYLMKGLMTLSYQFVGSYLPWLPQGAADFDGNGLADILWVDNADHQYGVWTSSVSSGSSSVTFTIWNSTYFGVPLLGAADFNGDARADVLELSNSDGGLYGDLPFFYNSTFWTSQYWLGGIPTSPNPYTPPFSGVVDANRDGTSDFYVQMPGGLQLFTMGDWKTGTFGAFNIAATSPVLGDGDWTVVGTGGFNEN